MRDRDSLRAEVAEMRISLEKIQSKHDEEMGALQNELKQSQNDKEHAETQFRNLLGKVNTIKSQLGERLKADAVRLFEFFGVLFFTYTVFEMGFPFSARLLTNESTGRIGAEEEPD